MTEMNGRRTVKGRLDFNGQESRCENLFIQKYFIMMIFMFCRSQYIAYARI